MEASEKRDSDRWAATSSLWEQLVEVPHRVRHVVTRDGVRTRVLEAGEGAPIIFLHGTGGHLEVFLRNIGHFAADHRVLAIDLLGHGSTDLPPPSVPFDWAAVAEHALATMDVLGIERATFVGEALGAQVAEWLAVRHPNRVERVVLCSAGVLPVEEADSSIGAAQARFQELTSRALDDPTSTDVMRERMTWLHLSPTEVDEEMLRLRMRFWSRKGFTEAHRRLLGSLRTARTDPRTALTAAELQAIEVPILLVWTERNPLFSLESARRLREYLPSSSLEVLSHSAMWPQFDEADAFNAAIRSWLNRAA